MLLRNDDELKILKKKFEDELGEISSGNQKATQTVIKQTTTALTSYFEYSSAKQEMALKRSDRMTLLSISIAAISLIIASIEFFNQC